MSKLMENTYHDFNIALADALVHISAELNIKALDVIDMANKHPRVNLNQPDPDVGGHCLAVDPYFIVAALEQSRLIQDARVHCCQHRSPYEEGTRQENCCFRTHLLHYYNRKRFVACTIWIIGVYLEKMG